MGMYAYDHEPAYYIVPLLIIVGPYLNKIPVTVPMATVLFVLGQR